MNDNVKMELIEPAERVRVNYAFLFLNEYVESMYLEKGWLKIGRLSLEAT